MVLKKSKTSHQWKKEEKKYKIKQKTNNVILIMTHEFEQHSTVPVTSQSHSVPQKKGKGMEKS